MGLRRTKRHSISKRNRQTGRQTNRDGHTEKECERNVGRKGGEQTHRH